MKKLTYILLAICASLLPGCADEETGPTIKVPEGMGEGSRIEAPDVHIIDLRTDGFSAIWKAVPDAASYEYSFDGGADTLTLETALVFDSLETDSEHVLRMRSLPRPESGRMASAYVTVNVVTSEILPLDMPNLQFGSTYSSVTVISWGVVPDAVSYEWELFGQDGAASQYSGSTTKTFVFFEGLIEGEHYTLKVRSMAGDNYQKTDSDWSEVDFIPTSNGTDKMFFSNFSSTCDGITFDVYASAGQYYLYDVIPKVKYNTYESEEAYLDSLRSAAAAKAQVLMDGGKSRREAFAQILNSGSANIKATAYSRLTYSVCVVGMTIDGERTGEFKRVELTTPAETDSDGVSYLSGGGWFTQSLSLGTSTTDETKNATHYISVNRKGTGVISVKYKLFSSKSFIKTYGSQMTDSSISDLISALTESTSQASDDGITRINSAAGFTTGYSKLTPGTDYTIAALATNEKKQQILAVNSIRTRTSLEDINWISSGYLGTITTSSFTIRVRLKGGVDAVSAKYYVAPSGEVAASWSKADYPALVESQGTALTDAQLADLSKPNGYFDMVNSGLQSATQYLILIQVTNSTGDTQLKSSALPTK